jgi:hypothetical protein
MPIINIPHKTEDYMCPVNGLADIYEWKTGERIPDKLLHYARSGFMLVSNKKADPPKIISFCMSSIGKKQYEFWSMCMDYRIHTKEGGSFKNTLNKIKSLIDRNIPVILFGLDMFHLEYHTKFYHKAHVPGHIVLMVGYDGNDIYIHDNSKEEVQKISVSNLEKAWADGYLGISKKNAYFGIEFAQKNRNTKEIVRKAIRDTAECYLNPPVGILGIKGFDRLIKELPEWHKTYDLETMESIYRFFIFLTGSILPEIPAKVEPGQALGFHNPHRATRDKFAEVLIEHYKLFGSENWAKAAGFFTKSGEIIETLTDCFCEDIINKTYTNTEHYIELLRELRKTEISAFRALI